MLEVVVALARRPILRGRAGDRRNVIARLGGQAALLVQKIRDAVRAAVIGSRREAQVAEARRRSASSFAEAGIACSGSNGLASPRSAAVPGMNCATPCAPAGLTTCGRNALSLKMSFVKKPTGNCSRVAELSTSRHKPRAGFPALARKRAARNR